jgi:hypothetical protein
MRENERVHQFAMGERQHMAGCWKVMRIRAGNRGSEPADDALGQVG